MVHIFFCYITLLHICVVVLRCYHIINQSIYCYSMTIKIVVKPLCKNNAFSCISSL